MEGTSAENNGLFQNGDRKAIYYIPEQNLAFQRQNSEDDELEPTVEEIRNSQRDLTNRVNFEVNRPFLPKSYLDRKNRALKEQAYKKTVIRFSIQNRFVLQANFYSTEFVSTIFEFVRNILVDPSMPFNLLFIREKIVEDSKKNLFESEIAPSCRLTLNFSQLSILPDNLLVLFNTSFLRCVSEQDADVERRNWLSDNSVYQSFESLLSVNDIQLRGSEKRAAEIILGEKRQGTSGVDRSKSTKPVAPKWFKRS